MALTKQQLQANEQFFKQVAQFTSMYIWPDYGFVYLIENGVYIADTKRAYKTLMENTPKTFHKNIKLKVF